MADEIEVGIRGGFFLGHRDMQATPMGLGDENLARLNAGSKLIRGRKSGLTAY